MIFTLDDLIADEEIKRIQENLKFATFNEGQLTAGWHAKQVKKNVQLTSEVELAGTIAEHIRSALLKHPLFQAAVLPKFIHSILISRYDKGMSYGRHIDNALMGKGKKRRADVSFTVFLNDPEAYEGGHLSVELSDGDRHYKLSAGSALIYPSSSLHQVQEVTEGQRLVAVGWVQSYIRDPAQRELLFDLDTARRSIFKTSGKTIEFDLISKSHSNLIRQWSD